MRLVPFVLVLLIGCTPGERPGARFAHQLAARFPSAATLQLFSPDAPVKVVGDGGARTVSAALQSVIAGFTDARLTLGRVWIDHAGTTAVVEAVFSGKRGAHTVSVAAAAIVTLADGRATSVRVYVDLVTAVGQLDPSQVHGLAIRPLEPPPARGVFVSTGSAEEMRNLAVANEVWAALDAHDPERVVASASADYRYVDFAAPTVLDREGTRAMVAGFLGAVGDFRIVGKPVQFAAGEFVVTEMIEHATFEGKPIELHGLDIKRVVGGRVVAEWQYSNTFELLSQIRGVTPPKLP